MDEPPPRAKLLVTLPADRYSVSSPIGRAPQIGDEVVIDQGFSSPEGLPMVLVYFPAVGVADLYEARVYESEMGPPLEKLHVLRQPSARLLERIRGWISEAKAEGVGTFNADGTGFMIYGDIGGAAYIRADGSIEIEEELPGSSWTTNPNMLISIVVSAAKRRPVLAELLPERSTSDTDCDACGATGWITIDSNFAVVCGTCHGLGWVSSFIDRNED